MKRLLSVLLIAVLLVGIGASSFAAIAPWLSFGPGSAVSGTVKTKTDTLQVSGTAYPDQATGMFNEINKVRKENGLNTLVRNTNLEPAAKQRALEIAADFDRYFSHTRPDGTGWRTVDRRANGENLGVNMAGYVEVTRDGFMKSSDHKALILDKDFNSLEVYCLESGGELFWVHLFSVQTSAEIQKDAGSDTAKSTSTKSPAVTSAAQPATTSEGTALSEATLVDLTKKAEVKNGVKTVSVNNAGVIKRSSLQAMQTASDGATVNFRADTRTDKGSFIARISINPAVIAQDAKDIGLGIQINNSKTKGTENFFAKWFKNHTQVIGLDHTGSFGGTVRIAAKLHGEYPNPENLEFYSYDAATNQYTRLTDTNYYIDANDFIHFDTSLGGFIVISDGVLTK